MRSCYFKCGLCSGNKSYFDKHFSGSIYYEGKAHYEGSKTYDNSKDYSGEVEINESRPYAGEVNCCGNISYSNSHNVNCNLDHHNCESCDAWVYFVQSLQLLIEEKEKCIKFIERQKNYIYSNLED